MCSTKSQSIMLGLVLLLCLQSSTDGATNCLELCSSLEGKDVDLYEDIIKDCMEECKEIIAHKIIEETNLLSRSERRPESSYLRIGRAVQEDEGFYGGLDGGYYRRPHYLRIGRSVDNVEAKRARASHYLRIGRGEEEGATEQESKRDRGSYYLRIGKKAYPRSRSSHYLRIGRGNEDDAIKRARASHYLRIGRAKNDNDVNVSDN